MAGGGHRAGTPPPAVVRGATERRQRRARTFCWVHAADSRAPGPWPGLVVEWHRGAQGWVARVVYVVGDDAEGVIVSAWMDASSLRPL